MAEKKVAPAKKPEAKAAVAVASASAGAAKPAPAPAAAAKPASAPAKATVPVAERHRLIAEAAYFLAQKRGFAPGHAVQDWLTAEKNVDAALARR